MAGGEVEARSISLYLPNSAERDQQKRKPLFRPIVL